MPKISALASLPRPLYDSLVVRLRSSGYGALVQTQLWLAEKGHQISKSSIHRYAVRLRAVDAKNGDLIASVETRSSSRAAQVSIATDAKQADGDDATAIRAEIDRLLDKLIAACPRPGPLRIRRSAAVTSHVKPRLK